MRNIVLVLLSAVFFAAGLSQQATAASEKFGATSTIRAFSNPRTAA